MRKIRKPKTKATPAVEVVKEEPFFSLSNFKDYPRIIGMFILLLFLPPIGWIFAYKYSPYDKKTTAAISVFCTAFFVYAVILSPQHEWTDISKFKREDFVTRYNEQVIKLAPNLNLSIAENNLNVDGDNFGYKFNDTLKLDAKVENNFVKEVDVVAAPKTTDDSFQLLNVCGLVVAVLNPELNQEKRGDVFRELQMLEKAADEDLNTSTVKGKVTYSLRKSDGEYFFTARLNDDF